MNKNETLFGLLGLSLLCVSMLFFVGALIGMGVTIGTAFVTSIFPPIGSLLVYTTSIGLIALVLGLITFWYGTKLLKENQSLIFNIIGFGFSVIVLIIGIIAILSGGFTAFTTTIIGLLLIPIAGTGITATTGIELPVITVWTNKIMGVLRLK